MLLTTKNKHLHPITAQIPDYSMDLYFPDGIDSDKLNSLMSKSIHDITSEDLYSLAINRYLLLIMLFPKESPIVIAEKIVRDLNEYNDTNTTIMGLVITHFFSAGKIEEIEQFFEKNPEIQAQVYSHQYKNYFSLVDHGIFFLCITSESVLELEKFLPTYLQRFKNAHKNMLIIEDIGTLIDAKSKLLNDLGSYCYSCEIFHEIWREIPVRVNNLWTLITRFPQDFDNYIDRESILQEYLETIKDSKENIIDLLLITNFDSTDEHINKTTYTPKLLNELAQKLIDYLNLVQVTKGVKKTTSHYEIIVVLTAIKKLVSTQKYLSPIISTNIIETLKFTAKHKVIDIKIRMFCARLLHMIINLSENDPKQSAEVQKQIDNNYQLYKDLYTPFHNFQFFQLAAKAEKKPTLPPSITKIVGNMYVDLQL